MVIPALFNHELSSFMQKKNIAQKNVVLSHHLDVNRLLQCGHRK